MSVKKRNPETTTTTEPRGCPIPGACSAVAEINKLRRLLAKCAEHAEDGLNGSANYALDRLTQIQRVAKHG